MALSFFVILSSFSLLSASFPASPSILASEAVLSVLITSKLGATAPDVSASSSSRYGGWSSKSRKPMSPPGFHMRQGTMYHSQALRLCSHVSSRSGSAKTHHQRKNEGQCECPVSREVMTSLPAHVQAWTGGCSGQRFQGLQHVCACSQCCAAFLPG